MSESSSSVPSSPKSTPPSSIPSPELATLSLADISEENKQEAAKIKSEANKAFVGARIVQHSSSRLSNSCPEHDFPKAAELYSKAIALNPGDATLWSNRAYTRIKLEEHGYALSDASTLSSIFMSLESQCFR